MAKQAKTLNERELQKLLDFVSKTKNPKRNRAIFLLTYLAGMRIGEVSALRVCDVLASDGSIRSQFTLNPDQTKGNDSRTVLLSQRMQSELAAYVQSIRVRNVKTPMYSTVRKHNVVMNMIFKEAIVRNYMSGLKMPYLETKGEKSENYATFTVTETNIILAKMPEWVANGREHHKAQRQVLHDYTRVLVDTGARPGKELLDLQWKNIDFEVQYESTGVEYVEDKDAKERQLNYEREYIELSNGPYDEEGNPIPNTTWTPIVTLYVTGKEGSRHAVGYDVTYRVLKEIADRRYKEIGGNKLKALIAKQSNDRIFETSDGKRIPSALHMFQNFLEEYGLLYDKNTGKKRVFYSFRSLFSTAVMDYDDVDMRDLAKALGNSPEMLMKRYDRGTLKQIKHKLKAPNARQQLFKEVAVPEIHESAKVKAKAEKAATKKAPAKKQVRK